MLRRQTSFAVLLWSCAVALLLGYAYFACRMFANPAFVFDELWFQTLSRGRAGWAELLLETENRLGYGAAYWIALEALGRMSALPAILWMRMFSLAAILLVPLSLLWIAARQRQPIAGLGAVLLWIALPMAWWDGKQAGPDIPSYVAAYLGFFLAATKAKWKRPALAVGLGGVLLGIGIGLKLTAMVGMAAAMAVLLFDQAERLSMRFKQAWHLAAGTLLGFLAANPFFVLAPHAFFRNLEDTQREVPTDYGSQLQNIFFADRYEWDGVYAGGFTQFGYSLAAFGLLVAVVFWVTRRKELAAALLAAFLVSTLLLLSNQRFLGWYWFPFLALTPFFVAALEFDPAPGRRYAIGLLLLASLLVLQCIGSFGTIASAFRNRMEHVRVLAEQDEVNRCLAEQAGPMQNYKTIIAFLDPGFRLRADRPVIEGFDAYRALRDGNRMAALRSKGEPFLLLLSRRLGALDALDFDAYRNLKGAKSGACDGVQYLAFRPMEH